MATTTLVSILARIGAVVEGEPYRLVPSRVALGAARQANVVVDRAYWLDDDGMVSSRPMGAYREARIDAVLISVTFQGAFAREAQRRAAITVLTELERALVADGDAQGYHVTASGRGVKRFGREHLLGTLRITVDYDFSLALA